MPCGWIWGAVWPDACAVWRDVGVSDAAGAVWPDVGMAGVASRAVWLVGGGMWQ